MTTTTATPDAALDRFDARLGTAPDGAPVTIHARGNVLIQGRAGSGKSQTYEHLARQWRALPDADVVEVRYIGRDQMAVGGHWGWSITSGGLSVPVTYERVTRFLTDLAASVRGPVADPPTRARLLLLEEVRLTTRPGVEAIAAILTYGGFHNLHTVVMTPSMDYLVEPLRSLCATTVFLDPTGDHTTAAADARQRAAGLGVDLPAGPGSFIVANDRCDVGRVRWVAPGLEEM